MKKYFLISLSVLAALVACSKAESSSVEAPAAASGEIVFGVADEGLMSAEVTTKATVVTSLSSFNVGCVTGTLGSSETEVWNAQFTKDGSTDDYKGGKYWPSSIVGYKFFASNVAMTAHSDGYTVAASNETDVVCALIKNPGYKSKNHFSFNHIFARLGDVTVSGADDYVISDVSISITPNVSGTFSMKYNDALTYGMQGWTSSTAGSPVEIANATPGTKSNDIFLVPGNYTLTATWTATKGGYTQTFTNKSSTVYLTIGKVNKLNVSLGGNASEIVFTVEINPWTETTIPITFPVN